MQIFTENIIGRQPKLFSRLAKVIITSHLYPAITPRNAVWTISIRTSDNFIFILPLKLAIFVS